MLTRFKLRHTNLAAGIASMLALVMLSASFAHAAIDVSTSGTAAYSHTIAVPPGVNGLMPNVTLAYSGGNRNGTVGVNWSLQGISSVTRCAAVRATDVIHMAAAFNVDDKLCLEGERLIPTNASGGSPVVGASTVLGSGTGDANGLGSGLYKEYRTEKDSYSRIRAYGFADGSTAASGPAYFKVWTKDGKIKQFGNNPNGSDINTNSIITISQTNKTAKLWAISRISDVFNNYIDFKYTQRDAVWGSVGSYTEGHEWNLAEIQYANNKVIFNYTDRTTGFPVQDGAEAYHAGAKSIILNRLASVTTYINSPNTTTLGAGTSAVAVLSTKLAYDNSPATGRSRLTEIKTCTGNINSTLCMPATKFTYSAGGDESYQAMSGFSLSNAALYIAPITEQAPKQMFGLKGVLSADFNGDGRSDIIRYSAIPSENELHVSNGDGTFTKLASFNITNDVLYSKDGCQQALAKDFNGDGLIDILRFATDYAQNQSLTQGNPWPCELMGGATPPSYLFLNKGDGSFIKKAITGLNYGTALMTRPDALVRDQQGDIIVDAYSPTSGAGVYWAEGKDFYIFDIDGDTLLDVITTFRPAKPMTEAYDHINVDTRCATIVCTRVFKGDGQGNFTEIPTNIKNVTLYQPDAAVPLGGDFLDFDHDGFPDLLVKPITGQSAVTVYRSRGNGNFDTNNMGLSFWLGQVATDYNGDGKFDLLWPGSGGGSGLSVKDTAAWSVSPVNNFNLKASSYQLGTSEKNASNIGVISLDFNGDGKQDLMQWYTAQVPNAYLSNGDGTFVKSNAFNLPVLRAPGSNMTNASFVLGDFTGRGQPEFLLLSEAGHSLYVKTETSKPDVLLSVTSLSGAKTSFTYVPISNPMLPGDTLGPRYVGDIGTSNAATGSAIDIAPSSYVVATMVTDNDVGGTIKSEFSYAGLKFDTKGRDGLGFRKMYRQGVAFNGEPITTETKFLQDYPYIGMAANTVSYRGALNTISPSSLLNSKVNVYCDQTSATGADATAIATGTPCTSSSIIKRPYLVQSIDTGKDPAGYSLPITKTTYSDFTISGDSKVVNTVKTLTNSVDDTYTTITTNSYSADNIYCSNFNTCNWILGRVARTSTRNIVPNTILTTSAGTAQYATDISGVAASKKVKITAIEFGDLGVGATLTKAAILKNESSAPVTITAPGLSAVTGVDFTYVSTTCGTTLAVGAACTVKVKFAPTAMLTRTGKLEVTTSVGKVTSNLTGKGTTPQAATISDIAFGDVLVGASSTLMATVSNSGTGPLAITIPDGSTVIGTDFTFESTTCGTSLAAGTTCKVSVKYAPTSLLTRIGTLELTTGAGLLTSNLTGKGTDVATATISNIAFGDVVVGASSTLTANIFNNGTGLMTITDPGAVSGTGFSFVTSTCTTSLAAGNSCQVSVKLAPTAAGPYTGSLIVSTSAGNLTSVLSGTGVTTLSATLTDVLFDTVQINTMATLTSTLKNNGVNPLTLPVLSSGSVTGPGFSFTTSTCGTSLAPGATCLVSVKFSPTDLLVYSGTLTVVTGSGSLNANLTGTGTNGGATLTISHITFGTVAVGGTINGTATLSNTSSGSTFNITTAPNGASVSGTDFSFVSSNCPVTLLPGTNCVTIVKFSPTAEVLRNGSLTINTEAGPRVSNLSGTAGPAVQTATMSPTVALGPVLVGNSTTSTAIITNTSTIPLSITLPASVSGSPYFSLDSTTCTASLAVDKSCTMTVKFAPTAEGPSFTGTLSVNTGAGQFNASLTGSGQVGGNVLVLTPSLDFGNVAVGSSADRTAILSNTSAHTSFAITIPNGASISGAGYTVASTTCQSTLIAGNSCDVVVRFTPTSAAPSSGSLIVSTDAGSRTTSLSGTGTPPPQAGSMSSTVPFGNVAVGASSTATALITNASSTVPLSITVPGSVSGTYFSLDSTTCTASLAASSTCTVTVKFAPTTEGARAGTLTVNTGAGQFSASLSGSTPAPQAGTISPTIAFGGVIVGNSPTSTAIITNTSSVPLSISVPGSVSGTYFTLDSTNCPASLAVGSSCTVTVKFAPTTEGPRAGTLSVTTGAGTLNSSLSGTGYAGGGALAITSSLGFGNVNVGASADGTATLTNSSTHTSFSITKPSGASMNGTGYTFVSTTCGTSLGASSNCSVIVRYAPQSAVASNGTLTVSTEAGPRTTTLSGTGTTPPPQTASMSSAVSFGNVAVGTTPSPTATATVTNTSSTTPLSITVPGAGNVTGTDFSFDSTTCTASLAASSTCTVTVKFTPSAGVLRTGTLSVTTGAGSFNASLSGTGTVTPTLGNSVSWTPASTVTVCAPTMGGGAISATYSFTLTGGAQTVTMSPMSSSYVMVTPSGWTSGNSVAAGTYSFTLRAGSGPTGSTGSLSITFGGTGQSSSINVRTLIQASCL